MVKRFLAGFGTMPYHPHYVPEDTRVARYAARRYRPLIYLLTVALIVIDAIKYSGGRPAVQVVFFVTVVAHAWFFVWRMQLTKSDTVRFYHPDTQFWRAQITLTIVSMLIFSLSAIGGFHHSLWVLFGLATFLISEHNSTRRMLFVLAEMALMNGLATYLGWVLFSGKWLPIVEFWFTSGNLITQTTGIILLTIIFRYLVKNIHGRDSALKVQQDWSQNLAEHILFVDTPKMQRAQLIQQISKLSNAAILLWLPHIKNGRFFTEAGTEASEELVQLVKDGEPSILLGSLPQELSHHYLQEKLPIRKNAKAQLLVPICRDGAPDEIEAILDFALFEEHLSSFDLFMKCLNLYQLTAYARFILMNSIQQELKQKEWNLTYQLLQCRSLSELIQQVLDKVVEEMGFDFATISLIDPNTNTVRTAFGKNARWIEHTIHSLKGDDVQSKVVRSGKPYLNDGRYESCLDGRIYHYYQHQHVSRIWMPISSTKPNSPFPALGTIEAGFHHRNRKDIPKAMQELLAAFAVHVGYALANVSRYERTTEHVGMLTRLHEISQEMQKAAVRYEPKQMIQLIGESAEELLKADVVTIYSLDEGKQKIKLDYLSKEAIFGKGHLCISLKNRVLKQLFEDDEPYYADEAQTDPLLVNMKTGNGVRQKGRRTFTQRQNIKSFAGHRLESKSQGLLGFICINFRKQRYFDDEFKHIIKLFAKLATAALEDAQNHRVSRQIAVDRERSYLQSELHHSLSQQLYGIRNYGLTAVAHLEETADAALPTMIYKIVHCADLSLNELETLISSLDEQMGNYNGDFITGIKYEIAQNKRLKPEISIDFFPYAATTPPPQVQFFLLRIAREALNNAVRHAKCSQINISYQVAKEGNVSLAIKDNGVGFDVAHARKSRRNGLKSLRFFAGEINSSLDIRSHIGCGTEISVCIAPLN